ncbi:type IIS restriction/modification enzyme [Candidatus Moduliflexus flocculans]|uniref:site-specific DNA-methyltransferase (adenine-specific) n=1 Tax=Candidatus Moduliflexus flocculans TaxID=1499966 RepID=A0A081BNA8_9BACT|nr:type IIS restriction/modification enzyme [Candidatus Moduliflexus flocculans]
MSKELKLAIQRAIINFSQKPVEQAAIKLFTTLGYDTTRQNPFPEKSFAFFKDSFLEDDARFDEEKAHVNEWQSVDLLFQLTAHEVSRAANLFDTKQVDNTIIETYLFFALELSQSAYTRTQLAQITREINKVFPMPALLVFKHGDTLTLSVINRRLNKQDARKDVLEKVTVIKDISIVAPHRAHIDILFDLSFAELQRIHKFTNFVELHNAWQKTLDTKELNTRFYRDLSNWYFWALSQVEFPDDAKPDRDIRNATNVIRLITRLIFVWFLKEKHLIPDTLFDPVALNDYLTYDDSTGSTYYKAILQNLFFATLNTEMRKDNPHSRAFVHRQYGVQGFYRYRRFFKDPDKALELFQDIPFLNGGLFECLDKNVGTPDEVRIDCFSDRPANEPRLKVPDGLFFGAEDECDLSAVYGDTKRKHETVRGLINILNSYKFTIAENTPIEEEIALDPELLGKVFENLLASYNPETQTTARKQTGSFYTPREIVNYMVDESLIAYLANCLSSEDRCHCEESSTKQSRDTGEIASQSLAMTMPFHKPETSTKVAGEVEARLRHLLSYTDEPHQFSETEVTALITALHTAKILDPACGSGAFPMGILHKMVHILTKLDPDNVRWRETQRQQALKETEQAFLLGNKEERDQRLLEINEVFEENASDYGRKLYLIENGIYGVDIQPIAVQIAKLRCFISLIVDQQVNPAKKNLGLLPLPNLETKFVAANTLIGIAKPQQMPLQGEAIRQKEAELAKVRQKHFTARSPKTKEHTRQEDCRLRTELADLLKSAFPADVTEQLVQWNPYDQNAKADFFDPEWMFGLQDGFDAVIGNPPYVLLQDKVKDSKMLEYFRKGFEVASYKVDLYHLFIEKGVNLLKKNGVLVFINPSNFLSNNYTILLRRFILTLTNLRKILNLEDSVFEASVNNCILLVTKKDGDNETKISFYKASLSNNELIPELIVQQNQNDFLNERCLLVPVQDVSLFSLLKRIDEVSKPLKFYAHVNFGMQLRDRKEFPEDVLENPNKNELSEWHKQCFTGKDIKRYQVTYNHRYCYFNRIAKRGGCWDETVHFTKNKILVRQIGETPIAGLDQVGYPVLNSAFMITSKEKNISTTFLLALINSKLFSFFWLNKFADKRKTFPKIKGTYLELLPIIVIDDQSQFIGLVDRILSAKQQNPAADTRALEAEIDRRVYALYGLTPEEIAIVEGQA